MKKTGLFNRSLFIKVLYKLRGGVITKRPGGTPKGWVLFSHDITPFINPDHPLEAHANYWTAVDMVQTFLEKGYAVDIINSRNKTFLPKKYYTYFVDLEQNMDRIAHLLNKDCIKILHITCAHWLFQNTAEYKRCLALKKRRGVVVLPSRLTPRTHSIERADVATMIGNDFTEETYAFAGKKIYRTPLPPSRLCDFPEDKDFDAARKNFIWFGGAGAVHKGLDLALEAFSEMPEYTLTIFGKSTTDEEFTSAYKKELTELPNIHVLGFIDFQGEEFRKIQQNTVALVYPSCSEGIAGAPVMSMHMGILPIVSYESGVDIAESGITLKENTIECIRESVRTIANLPTEELRRRSKIGWEHARSYYTRESYGNAYRAFVDELEKGMHKKS
ncbi:MAG: glycosyltransferase [Candidatus Adlerbacteria bacterium]|nr:glycosyltransferase [Candidatus Adlerbacteria bacterium]